MKPDISRTAMSRKERDLRSRAKRLLDGAGLLHGTLDEREQTCGKPTCRCTRGERHRCLVLTVRREGKVHQLYIPKPLEATVRQWVQQERKVQDLLRQISQLHWKKIERQKKKRR
jgi:hypothetical protein